MYAYELQAINAQIGHFPLEHLPALQAQATLALAERVERLVELFDKVIEGDGAIKHTWKP